MDELSKDRGKGVGRSGSLDLFEGLDGLVNVGFGIAEVLVGKDTVSLLVENVGNTSGEEPESGLGDAKVGTDLIALVGQNTKGQSHFGSKRLLGLNALSGDSNNIGTVCLADLINAVVEGSGLYGAAGTRIGGIKVDHQWLFDGRSFNRLAVLVDQGKVGSCLADGKVEGRGGGSGRLGHESVGGSHEAGGRDDSGNKLHGGGCDTVMEDISLVRNYERNEWAIDCRGENSRAP